MTDYLKRASYNWDDPKMAAAYDQLSNWSPYFGELILNHVTLRENITALDVGCGTGYPIIELSQRLGPTSTVYGVDPFKSFLDRARQKAEIYGLQNVIFKDEDATSMSFEENRFDLIVSNVGINNFEDNMEKVFAECFRVAKPGAQIAFTTNPIGHMQEFYDVYQGVLADMDLEEEQF